MGAPGAFVGRATEVGALLEALDRSLSGHTTTVFVAGEAGIGKTRLLVELERLAGSRAVPVLWGRATSEEGAPAFWPWRQILRSWLSGVDADRAASLLGETAEDLGRITPEVAALTGSEPAPAAAAADAEQRFALFESVSLFLVRVAAVEGLVVVLDDLHWADTATLRLLVHVAHHVRDARLLLVGAFRPVELSRVPAADETVAALTGQPATRRIDLAGLSTVEVADQLALVLGRHADDSVTAMVAHRTAGNPLFVQEVGRLLAAGADGVPSAVRTAIAQRLAYLDASGRALLATAAVVSTDIDPSLLATVSGLGDDAVVAHLDAARAVGLVERRRGSIGLRFAHDLTRECCLLEVPGPQRRRLHLAVAEYLERRGHPQPVTEIAHHRIEALPLGDARAAVSAAVRAARMALSQFAYEDSARLFASALQAASSADVEPSTVAQLLVERSRAHHLANDIDAAMADCEQAASLARQAGDVMTLARAALTLDDVTLPEWRVKVDRWSREALGLLDSGDSPLRAQLLAQRSVKQVMVGDLRDVHRGSAEALAMAERLDDPTALSTTLNARHLACSGPDGAEERLELADRMIALGARIDDPSASMWGHLWRFDAQMQLGRTDDAEAELSWLEPVVNDLRRPAARWHLLRSQTAMHLARGRFDEALATSHATIRLAQQPHNEGIARAVQLVLSMCTGDEAIAAEVDFVGLVTGWALTVYPVLARWHLAFGRVGEARRLYEQARSPSASRLPVFSWLVVDANQAAVAAALGDSEGARLLYDRLRPYADHHVVGGAGAVSTFGSTHHFLGLSAAAFGDFDRAVEHLRCAVAANAGSGLPPAAAESRCCLAETLLQRDGPGDRSEAAGEAGKALRSVERLGMRLIRARADAIGSTLQPDRTSDPLSRREREIAELVAEGLTNRQIADRVHIAERTAENHVQHILTKLGFNTRSQIAVWIVSERSSPA